jgi:hypothetical protein
MQRSIDKLQGRFCLFPDVLLELLTDLSHMPSLNANTPPSLSLFVYYRPRAPDTEADRQARLAAAEAVRMILTK